MELYLHYPNTPSWRGAQLKHSENFTFIFYLKGRYHSQDLGVDEKTILDWILGKYDGKLWTGSGQGPVVGSCEHGNETSASRKGRGIS
jgi:hypothetical protein